MDDLNIHIFHDISGVFSLFQSCFFPCLERGSVGEAFQEPIFSFVFLAFFSDLKRLIIMPSVA